MMLRFDVPEYANTAGGSGSGVMQEIESIKKSNLLWHKRQIINGLTVEIALTKDRRILIAYPQADAGFWGTAKTEEDVTDALLMVLTYHSPPVLHENQAGPLKN